MKTIRSLRVARSTWWSAAFAVASLALVAVLFGGAAMPTDDTPRLAQAGAEIAPWIIGVIVVALIAGAAFLILGRRKKG